MHEYQIFIGADHRGFSKKEGLITILQDCHENVAVVDKGAYSLKPDDDFNEPAIAVALEVVKSEYNVGVLLCGSAQGVCIQANRIKGARAIRATTPEEAMIARQHDHANILCLPADDLEFEAMEPIIKAFCHARPLADERYVRRVQKLDADINLDDSEEE